MPCHTYAHFAPGFFGFAQQPEVGMEVAQLNAANFAALFDDHRRQSEGKTGIGAGHAGGAGAEDGNDHG
jgi:hypothetical protein